MEKQFLLNQLLEKKVIANAEDFENLSEEQLKHLLDCNAENEVVISNKIEEEKTKAFDEVLVKGPIAFDQELKARYEKSVVAERVAKQKCNKLIETLKVKIKELAKELN